MERNLNRKIRLPTFFCFLIKEAFFFFVTHYPPLFFFFLAFRRYRVAVTLFRFSLSHC